MDEENTFYPLNMDEKTYYYINPTRIKNITPATECCDYTQKGKKSNPDHPHAALDRGVFREDENGILRILSLDWDDGPNYTFEELLEYQAIKDHIDQKITWKNSQFCKRNIDYIKSGFENRGINDISKFLEQRPSEIDRLIRSIKEHGVRPRGVLHYNGEFIDNISINVNRMGQPLFNNRGHHRLAIAKCLGVARVPVRVTVAYSLTALKVFETNPNTIKLFNSK